MLKFEPANHMFPIPSISFTFYDPEKAGNALILSMWM